VKPVLKPTVTWDGFSFERKPKLYPRIPRIKREKRVYGSARTPTSTPVTVFNDRWADWAVNGVMLNPNLINAHEKVVLGTDGKSYVSTPDWKVKIAKGADASSPYSRQGISRKIPAKYNCLSTVNNYRSSGRGSVYCGSYLEPKDYSSLVAIATGRLKHKLSGHIGNAQLAAPLAESREIHRIIRQINGLGMETLKAVLALKKTKGRSVTKLFGNIWLGFAFGVNPMLKDLKSAADSILKYTTRQDYNVKLSAGASMDWFSAHKGTADLAAYLGYYGFSHDTHHEQSVRITAGIDLQTRSAASYSMPEHLGLKISAVPGTLWELTPFSWVVDYFVTVGPWLDDMFFTLPGVLKYCVLTKKYRSVTYGNIYFQKVNASDIGDITGSGGTAVVDAFAFSREVLATLPSQPIRIKSVDEVAAYGIAKLLNLASVIAGRHGGPRLD